MKDWPWNRGGGGTTNNLLGGPEHGGVFAAAAPPEHRFGLHASLKGFLAPGTGARRGHVARAMLKSGWEALAPLRAPTRAILRACKAGMCGAAFR